MVTVEMELPALCENPVCKTLIEEARVLLSELADDTKYTKRVGFILALLADPNCLQADQIYFLPRPFSQNRLKPH
jgi:hypothetical protein